MSADPDHLTRPEKFAAFGHARPIVRKFMERGKACSICLHGESYFGEFRCKGNPARAFPGCDRDREEPTFELNEAALALKGKIHG